MQYLVTGGTGFIGSHLVDALIEEGHDVLILSSKSSATPKEHTIQFVSGNIADMETLKPIFSENQIDGVFHLAALNNAPLSLSQPKIYHEVNIMGTLNILKAACDTGVKTLVYSSSALVYGKTTAEIITEDEPLHPLTPYAISKITGELYCQMFTELYGMSISSLRYFNTYGSRQDAKSEFAALIPKFIDMILRKESPTIYGTGEQARDFIYVKDVVQANILAMKKNATGVFNIGSGVSTSLNTIANTILELAGTEVSIKYQPARQKEMQTITADISKAKRELGFEPHYSIGQGLQETVEYFRSNTTD